MVGSYLDALPFDAKQRLVSAQTWCTHGYVDRKGGRCLLGHAEDWHWDAETQSVKCGAPELLELREAGNDSWLNWPPMLGRRFDRLVERYGMEQTVLLIQNRVRRVQRAGIRRKRTVAA